MFNKEQKKIPSRFFLGLFMLMITIRLAKSVELYFNPNLANTLIQIGLMACFMIGPTLFVYIVSCFSSEDKNDMKKWKIMLSVFAGLLIIFGIFFSYPQNPDLWKRDVVKIIYIFWFVTSLISVFAFWILSKKNKGKIIDKLLIPVFICTIIVSGAYFYSYITKSRISYISGSILFTLFLYLNFFMFFPKKDKTVVEMKERDKYANKKIPEKDANDLLGKLQNIVQQEELYKDPNLKLSDLASRINISAHQLSQLLNDNMGKSFNTYINEFRIEEACKKILSDSNLKIEEIGYEVGFNSKSTFFTTFKKIKNTTPLLYRNSVS